MKKVVLAIVLGLIFVSCSSDKLTEGKVEDLFNECLDKNTREKYETITIQIGDKVELSCLNPYGLNIEDYSLLNENGFIKQENIRKKGSWTCDIYCKVSLTDKMKKEFILDSSKRDKYKWHTIKLCKYKLDKVNSIRLIPQFNIAEVKITLKKVDKTPLYNILQKDAPEFIEKKISLTKTENKGWVYCE